MLWSSFFSFLIVAECRLTGFAIEEMDEKSVDPAFFQRNHGKTKKIDENSFYHDDSRFKPLEINRPNGKIENDKVGDLFGKQHAETNSRQGQVYRTGVAKNSVNWPISCQKFKNVDFWRGASLPTFSFATFSHF